MARFRARFTTIVDRDIDAFDITSAERQARIFADGLRFKDSDGDPQHASLYSIEEIKEAPNGQAPRTPTNPFAPRPQRRFAA